MLCLSGTAYLVDTLLDGLAVAANPGLGAFVPIFGLVGFPGFWLSLRRTDALALVAYGLGMIGLAGLVAVTFLNNRLFPDLAPQEIGAIITAIRPEFLVIGVAFLASALLMVPACWRAGPQNRAGAALYALGAVPVSLPPLMPPALVTTGGICVAVGLLIWGAGLLKSGTAQA